MKKIKLGAIGEDAFRAALYLTEQFNTCELYAAFETNKNRLNTIVQLAIDNGIYIKAFTNSDDFYASNPDMVFIGENMQDYIFAENSCLISGLCEDEHALSGIAATKDDKLYFYDAGMWNLFDESRLSAADKLIYLKNDKNPLVGFYLFKQQGGI